MALLEATGLSKSFGGLAALSKLDLAVQKGMILGIIGPNGAGKTTLFNVLTGSQRASSGEVRFNGHAITRWSTSRIASAGLVRTFQANSLFRDRTTFDNVVLAHYLRRRSSMLAQFLGGQAVQREHLAVAAHAKEIIAYLGLESVSDQICTNLPQGLQRSLGVAMAMAAGPELLLLDEPMAGMNAQETATMVQMVKGIRQRGMTIVIVEHDMKAIMGLSDRVVVLNFGQKIAEGLPQEIVRDSRVIEAYLGTDVTNV